MANIIAVTDADIDAGDASGFLFKERVSAPLLNEPHFPSQLIERIGWALTDAEEPGRTSDGSTR